MCIYIYIRKNTCVVEEPGDLLGLPAGCALFGLLAESPPSAPGRNSPTSVPGRTVPD